MMSITEGPIAGRLLAFGDFVFDSDTRKLVKGGVILKVDSKPLDLLEVFLHSPQKVLTRDYLLNQIWGSRFVAESALSVVVAKLRKVLGTTPGGTSFIENRYGQGYRFRSSVTQLEAAALATFPTPVVYEKSSELATVGREESLARLQAALVRATSGRGSLVTLVGEPGIGKTHLAEALERAARAHGARCVWGRLQSAEGLPPLWPFAQIIAELDQGSQAKESLRILRDFASAPDSHAAPLTDLFRYDATSTSIDAIRRIVETIHAASRTQPVLLFLDDLQWADAATLRTLTHLLSDITHWPLLIVSMVRRAELELEGHRQAELRRLLAHRNCERIELSRLSEADTAEYLRWQFNSTSAELTREVYARSEGNPFFMVELLRPWADTEAPEPAQLHLSDLALDLVRQRIRALPAPASAVLSIASVIGRDFDLGLVAQVDGRGTYDILEAIDVALAQGTIVESLDVHGAYAFDHELIREVLYSELPALDRSRLHLKIGTVLETRRAAGVAVASSEIANHMLRALPHGDVDHAIVLARAAATAARRMCSHSEVRTLLLRALEASKFSPTPNPETLATLLLELTMVERALGDVSYVGHLERVIELATMHGFGELLAMAGRLLSPTRGLPSSPEAFHVLTSALKTLPPEASDARARVLVHLAWTPPNCENAEKVNALLAEAETLTQNSQDADTREVLLAAKLFFNSAPDRREYADMLADELDRELRANPQLAQQGLIVAPWLYRIVSAAQRGDKAGLQRAIAERKALVKLNNVELEWHQERIPLIMSMNRGEFAGLQQKFERLREQAHRMQLQAWRDVWGRDYGTYLMWTGDISSFAARARPALRASEMDIPMIRARKIIALAEYGFHADSRRALDQLPRSWLKDLPHDREYLVVLSELATASAIVGNLERCRELYDLLCPYAGHYAASVSYHNEGSISHMLGLLARALGRDVDALARFEASYQHNTNFELFAAALRSRFELAKLLLDSRVVSDRHRSHKLLKLTYEEASSREMKPLAEASRALLQQSATDLNLHLAAD
jgi:DNA-binding winged helix-turn-helix (wHTH) protein